MTVDDFSEAQAGLFRALPRIFDAFIDARRGPDDEVVCACSSLFGCSPDEFRKMFARYARSRGKALFFAGHPAFEAGGEQDRAAG